MAPRKAQSGSEAEDRSRGITEDEVNDLLALVTGEEEKATLNEELANLGWPANGELFSKGNMEKLMGLTDPTADDCTYAVLVDIFAELAEEEWQQLWNGSSNVPKLPPSAFIEAAKSAVLQMEDLLDCLFTLRRICGESRRELGIHDPALCKHRYQKRDGRDAAECLAAARLVGGYSEEAIARARGAVLSLALREHNPACSGSQRM
eukprot:Clim_evm89s149 gene=Clim_evmTU89s149